jgi:carbamate kinase
MYSAAEAESLNRERGWEFKPDGPAMRRVVPSPRPKRIFGIHAIEMLLDLGFVVICSGGGGIPTVYSDERTPSGRRLIGVEAVIDKDLASALLACDLGADALIIATDVDGVYRGWGTPEQELLHHVTAADLRSEEYAEGSMGPKVRAACMFVEHTSGFAAIGTLTAIEAMIHREAGTIIGQAPAAAPVHSGPGR